MLNLLLHQLICFIEYILHDAFVFMFRHAARDYYAARFPIFFVSFIQLRHQPVDLPVIPPLSDYHEFIPADSKYGAVFEYVANDQAGIAQELIPRVVPLGVIDLL